MEITMTITVTVEQAEKIVQFLKGAESPTAAPPAMAAPVQTAPVQQAAPQPQYGAPVQQYSAPATNSASVQPAQPATPTAAPAYSIAQLQTACAPLMDAGKGAQLQQLVQSFGVNTLMDIPPARYGEFANGLRQLGGVL